ncbi:tigger transposable element-derived protein 4 [Elysia marginata]|uniref:Tigger transposable element-derived protein 4 n=1 Tax=Elysia marginata TaxID=1093978 RepID=A0AAV4H7W2_9GAST|nr:tigger transposable element-derived protein 4 [Elysia marginata]
MAENAVVPSTVEDCANDSAGAEDNSTPRTIRVTKRILTVGLKLKIINDIENGVERSVILKQYKLPQSTLSTIIANKEDIKKRVDDAGYSPQRRKFKKSKYHEIEEQLCKWCKAMSCRSEGESLTNAAIGKKALELASQLGMSDFNANASWIGRFRLRWGLQKTPAAKLAKVKPRTPANPDLIEHWTLTVVPEILSKYDPNDIFIAHETGLFFRCLPESMLPLNGERCLTGRLPKDRLTVMLICNMTGTEKLPLLVVGRYARPKSLKYVQTLPTEYVSNKKVWMLPMFFEEWVKKFDNLMEDSSRRVALFVTPCDSHTHVENLNSVSLVFLPPDINIQPAHQGIIQTLKQNYRRIVLEKYLDRIEQIGPFSKLPISVMDALLWLREAWGAVTPECISNGFKQAGISLPGEETLGCDMNVMDQNTSSDDFYTVFEKLGNFIAMDHLITAESYLHVDSHLVTMGAVTGCEMMVAKRDMRRDVMDDEAEDQDEAPETAPSILEARQSLATLLKFFEHVKGGQESFSLISEMEQFVHKLTTFLAINGHVD